ADAAGAHLAGIAVALGGAGAEATRRDAGAVRAHLVVAARRGVAAARLAVAASRAELVGAAHAVGRAALQAAAAHAVVVRRIRALVGGLAGDGPVVLVAPRAGVGAIDGAAGAAGEHDDARRQQEGE